MNWLDKKEHDDKIRYEEKLKEEERKREVEAEKQRKIQRKKEIKKEIHELIPRLEARFLLILQRFAHPSTLKFPNSPREVISKYRNEFKSDIMNHKVGLVENTFLTWKLIKPYSKKVKTSHDAILLHYFWRQELISNSSIVAPYTYGLSERLESIFFCSSFHLKFSMYRGRSKKVIWNCKHHGSLIFTESELEVFQKKFKDYNNDRYLLYGLNRYDKGIMKKLSSSKEIIQVKEEIISEIERYNNRIDELMEFENVNDLRNELLPHVGKMAEDLRKHLFGIDNYKTMLADSWDEVPNSLICRVIIINALSKIKGNPYKENPNINKSESKSSISNSNENLYYSTSFDRHMTRREIEDDHIYIDGVGWMHEDEVGTDR